MNKKRVPKGDFSYLSETLLALLQVHPFFNTRLIDYLADWLIHWLTRWTNWFGIILNNLLTHLFTDACLLVDCYPPTVDLEFSSREWTTTIFFTYDTSTVQYSCDIGYTFEPENATGLIECAWTGLWDPPVDFICIFNCRYHSDCIVALSLSKAQFKCLLFYRSTLCNW